MTCGMSCHMTGPLSGFRLAQVIIKARRLVVVIVNGILWVRVDGRWKKGYHNQTTGELGGWYG